MLHVHIRVCLCGRVCGTDSESWAQSPQSFATVDDKLSCCHGYHNTDAPVTSSAMKSGTFSITAEDSSFIDWMLALTLHKRLLDQNDLRTASDDHFMSSDIKFRHVFSDNMTLMMHFQAWLWMWRSNQKGLLNCVILSVDEMHQGEGMNKGWMAESNIWRTLRDFSVSSASVLSVKCSWSLCRL